jgi:hypothetical protein
MIELFLKSITILLILHWLADFILQSNWQAQNKSSNNYALLAHVSTYTLVLCVIDMKFALFNGLTHLVVDYITSRISKKLWLEKEVHYFFVIIGLDQLIHTIILMWSYHYMVGWNVS